MHVVAAILRRRIDGLLSKRDLYGNREQYKGSPHATNRWRIDFMPSTARSIWAMVL